MLPLLLFLSFLIMPVLEIYLIIQVGGLIGGWQTAALLLFESLLGAWIVRREGRRAWRGLSATFGRGAMPDRELADAALVLIGGALLLTPGFLTDVLGFLFVLPVTRPLVRRALLRYAARRVSLAERRMAASFPPGFPPGAGPAEPPRASGPSGSSGQDGPVIRGEVVREDRTDS
jgi:UPF0716 protein FxsA